jgi:dienelactone hydrolase
MRPLETIAGIASVCGVALLANPHACRIWLRPLGFLVCAILLAHSTWEGWRLQAAPVYVAGALLVGLASFPRLCASAAALCGAVGLLACYAIPVFALPTPTGPHRVGSRTIHMSDTSRRERHRSGPRRFVAEVWYPAAANAAGERAIYRDPGALTPRSHHQRLVKTHAIRGGAALANAGGWPLVFFSPSSGGYRTQNTFLCEELASHGFVVVGVDHPFSSSRVVMSDGKTIHSLPSDWLQIATQASWRASIPFVEATLETRAEDVLHAWKELERDAKLPADFSRAAAIGHSFGGAVAAELCRRDRRFRTGANFDGWMFQAVREQGVAPDFLFAMEDDPLWARNEGPFPDNYDGNARLGTKEYHDTIRMSLRRHGGYLWRPQGAGHGDFSDLALYLRWPMRGQSFASERRVRRLHRETREMVLALLNKHLKGEASPLLDKLAQTKED